MDPLEFLEELWAVEEDLKIIKERSAIWLSACGAVREILATPFILGQQVKDLYQKIDKQYEEFVKKDELQFKDCVSVQNRLLELKQEEQCGPIERQIIDVHEKFVKEMLELCGQTREAICNKITEKKRYLAAWLL